MITPPPSSTLFPYTTLFRSERDCRRRAETVRHRRLRHRGRDAAADLPLSRHHADLGRRHLGRRDAEIMADLRSEEHTSELQSRLHLVCRLLLEKKKTNK